MDKTFKPDIFEANSDAADGAISWTHWKRRFNKYIATLRDLEPTDKLDLLINMISPKEPWSVSTQNDSSIDQYIQTLENLSMDCTFEPLSLIQHKKIIMRDAFVTGLRSPFVRQRILKSTNLNLYEVYAKARSLEMAQIQAASYNNEGEHSTQIVSKISSLIEQANDTADISEPNVAAITKSCFFCNQSWQSRTRCPARNVIHHSCSCRSRNGSGQHKAKAIIVDRDSENGLTMISATTGKSSNLSKAEIEAKLNGIILKGLIDTGSSENFIDDSFAHSLNLPMEPCLERVSLAASSKCSVVNNTCQANVWIGKQNHNQVRFLCLKNNCHDIFLGHPFMSKRQTVEPSHSPWRAQIVIVTGNTGKRRMVIDYGQTIIRFTVLDAYPRTDSLVQIYSKIDMRTAYHQLSLQRIDRPYTSFGEDGKLYQIFEYRLV
ncbi:hypothetical protein ACOME3_006581 [Neoechinorhynchus agilis]